MQSLKKKTFVTAALLGALALTSAAQASVPKPLVDVGDGTVYDPNKHLIWLKDWNLNGSNSWATQKSWAEGLTFAGSSDWELPTIYQYIELRTAYGGNLTSNTLPFKNVQSYYWSSTGYGSGTANAWNFGTTGDFQYGFSKNGNFAAVAVRTGDVSAPVPEPETYAMLLAGLGALAVVARRRAR
ncbi:FxDxF family PEP-CTERM protein [Paucibacter sp. TC2R-5]|uniref:Lcl C-terminal domain-containing protein n=1 Tax=Paucibacter sp. TC2R-5 TaxID=2893555 RepID=UPI0021E3B3DD|nr:FxDxF family PEP-CTERM protein [Paucibacter sp. TC2R-5]MCV2360005.1 FxDxF family PEP-CTERM protein [Paucibacter sp. TC2R-5]